VSIEPLAELGAFGNRANALFGRETHQHNKKANKYIMKIRYGLVFLGTLIATTVMAQTPFGGMTSSVNTDSPADIANQIARLTKLLTLTGPQVTEATTIFTNASTALTPLETTLRTEYTALDTAIKADEKSTITSICTEIGTQTGEVLNIQNTADAAFYAILTTAQQTILNAHGGFNRGGIFGDGHH
jgi:hypothetical protein